MTVSINILSEILNPNCFLMFPNVTHDAITAACNSKFGIVSKFSLIGAKLDLPAINAQSIEFDDMTLR